MPRDRVSKKKLFAHETEISMEKYFHIKNTLFFIIKMLLKNRVKSIVAFLENYLDKEKEF